MDFKTLDKGELETVLLFYVLSCSAAIEVFLRRTLVRLEPCSAFLNPLRVA